MRVKYNGMCGRIILVLFIGTFLSAGISYSRVDEKKKAESVVYGVTIVSLDAPLRATIGGKVTIEIAIGNERASKVTTILTVTCPTTKQQIGREAETLEGLTSQKIVYTWNTEGLKEGTYVIRAELEKVPDETIVDDNVRQIEILLQR
ncbi:MAG: hypothetical protein E3K36_02480 [Candidatus Brocadia sp.]|nr:hypothetical protein [Candidatus Brocadia sp.]